MGNIKTIIVDDEAPSRRRMKKLLSDVEDINLEGEAENGAQAIELIKKISPDLILLDIQLKDMTGFDVLKSIDPLNPKIIFITAYDEYAIQAFEENAIDYLLKPYKEARFYEAMERVKERHDRNEKTAISDLVNILSKANRSNRIQIPEGKTVHYIDGEKLAFVQANSHYSNFHFVDEKARMIRISLKSLEFILPDNFARVSKSLIVNKNKISSVRQLKNTIEIELTNQKFTLYHSSDRFKKLGLV